MHMMTAPPAKQVVFFIIKKSRNKFRLFFYNNKTFSAGKDVGNFHIMLVELTMFPDDILERDRGHLVGLQRGHHTELVVDNPVNRGESHAGGQDPVKSGRGTTALDIAQVNAAGSEAEIHFIQLFYDLIQ